MTAPVEDRSALHAKFASLVGEAIAVAHASLGNKAAAAAADLQQADAELTGLTAAVDAAKTTLSNCEEATAAAKAAQSAAEDAKDETEDNLEKQTKELSNVDKTKEKCEKQSAELAAAIEIVSSPASTSKDGKKVCATLKTIGATESMLNSMPAALGKWETEGFEAMILREAAKVLSAKAAEVNTNLANWDGHVHNMKARQQSLTQLLAESKTTLEAKIAAVKMATENQKAATAGVKSAESAAKAAQKTVDGKTNGKSKADGLVEDAEVASKAFQFLHTRTAAVAEEAPAGSPAKTPA